MSNESDPQDTEPVEPGSQETQAHGLERVWVPSNPGEAMRKGHKLTLRWLADGSGYVLTTRRKVE